MNYVWNDDCTSTTHAKHPKHQREEEQLGLLGLAHLEKIGGNGIVIKASLERGIRQDQRILVLIGVLIGAWFCPYRIRGTCRSYSALSSVC